MINKLKKILKNKLYRELDKKDITLRELREFQENGAIIIDVRSKQEYEEGHVDGSILIPEYEIRKEIEKIIKDKNKNIVVYCSSGGRSKKAQKILNKMGYENVYNLYNGITSYLDFYWVMLKLII